MAKLSKAMAKKAADKADEWQDFVVLDPGIYLCRLAKVATDGNGPAGPYWTWEYETVGAGEEPQGRKFWDNTSLSDKAIGRIGKIFIEAFGVPADTDTDDVVGHLVALEIGVGTINKGERMGEKRNEIRRVLAPDAHPLFEEFNEGAVATSARASSNDFD